MVYVTQLKWQYIYVQNLELRHSYITLLTILLKYSTFLSIYTFCNVVVTNFFVSYEQLFKKTKDNIET